MSQISVPIFFVSVRFHVVQHSHAQAVPFSSSAHALASGADYRFPDPGFGGHILWMEQINEIKSATDDCKTRGAKPSILRTLLDSDLPAYDKSDSRLMEDAQTLLGGDSVTTSIELALATYYILSDEHVLKTLTDELTTAIPDAAHTLPLVEVEKLEYLTATTFETLRISHSVTHQLHRVSPDQPLRYHDRVIPAGMPVGMTSVHIHNNTDIFPDPLLFKPERWLPLETEGRRLQEYLIAFSRGSRQCLGMNLGSVELYMGLAGVFGNLGHSMKVVDTVKERTWIPVMIFLRLL